MGWSLWTFKAFTRQKGNGGCVFLPSAKIERLKNVGIFYFYVKYLEVLIF